MFVYVDIGYLHIRTFIHSFTYTHTHIHSPSTTTNTHPGMGKIAEVLVTIIEQSGGAVHLSSPVDNIVVTNGRATGLKLSKTKTSGKTTSQDYYSGLVQAKLGVLCNANIWALPQLLRGQEQNLTPAQRETLLVSSAERKKTKSFMHLHLGLDATGLDLTRKQPHFTVMDKGLHCDGKADPVFFSWFL